MNPSYASQQTRESVDGCDPSVLALALLPFVPFDEGAKQIGAFRLGDRRRARAARLGEESIEMIALGGAGRGLGGAVDPVLRQRRAMPALERRREIHLAPFRMARRLEEGIEVREEAVDEFGDLLIADGVARPIERDEYGADLDGVDATAGRHQLRIIVVGERRGIIAVLELLDVRHGEQLEPASILDIG